MRIILIVLFLLIRSLAYAQNWQEIKSEHFVLFYASGTPPVNSTDSSGGVISAEDFSKDVLYKAEGYYEKIAGDLGYQRSSEFWTWDKRAKIYIYPGHEAFIKTANHPVWAGGMADYDNKAIISYLGSKDFTVTILPHEIAHLIFRDFVGFKGQVPLWLDEGVAQWTEIEKRLKMKKLVKEMLVNDKLLTIEDMMKFSLNVINNGDREYIMPTRTIRGEKRTFSLTGNNLIATFYVEAVSLVGFLIEKFGKFEFTNFCRALRDGKGVEESLSTVYSSRIRNLEDFEKQWREYVESDT